MSAELIENCADDLEAMADIIMITGQSGRLQAKLTMLRAAKYLRAPSPSQSVAEADEDTRPRYSMKRMRDELAKAKAYARREAIEEAAAYHDDRAADHATVGYVSDHHETMVREHRWAAAAIRALAAIGEE